MCVSKTQSSGGVVVLASSAIPASSVLVMGEHELPSPAGAPAWTHVADRGLVGRVEPRVRRLRHRARVVVRPRLHRLKDRHGRIGRRGRVEIRVRHERHGRRELRRARVARATARAEDGVDVARKSPAHRRRRPRGPPSLSAAARSARRDTEGSTTARGRTYAKRKHDERGEPGSRRSDHGCLWATGSRWLQQATVRDGFETGRV